MLKGEHETSAEVWRRQEPELVCIIRDGKRILNKEVDEILEEAMEAGIVEGINAWKWLRDYNSLPFSGGWAEQPAIVLDVISALSQEAADYNEEQAEFRRQSLKD